MKIPKQKQNGNGTGELKIESQALLKHIPLGLLVSDREMNVKWVNDEMAAMLGYEANEMIGKPWYELVPAMAEHRQYHDKVWAGEFMALPDAKIPFPEGNRYFEVHYRPILGPGGEVCAMLSMAHEITKRKRTEEKVKQTYSELNRSEKMLSKALVDLKMAHEELKATQLQLIQAEKLESVGRLAAGVAHEVKNPLAIIQLDVDYLSNTLTNGDATTSMILQDINNAVKRADSVIKGLLNFSASREFFSEIGEFNSVIEQSLTLVKHELDRSHIQLVKELGEDLPPVRLDRNKIEQVFINLFMNAIQAMPKGGSLSVKTYLGQFNGCGTPDRHGEPDKLADRLRVGDTIVIAEVNDSGTGIPENQLSKIFDPFFTTKPTGKGTGLGLTVTNKIVELHGGAMDIGNRKEGGVKVRVMLKAQRKESQ
ncbi:MAG: PAS domain-containing protein [Deltaproteobacteria bacterium]|nr:PAS domain-containing protein [Deltaproteobacteria bacterium]